MDTEVLISRTLIVIPVKDDPLIFRCLESIDEPVEVVVVANGSTAEFLQSLSEFDDFPFELVRLEELSPLPVFSATLCTLYCCTATRSSLVLSACYLGCRKFERGAPSPRIIVHAP